ncbi:hypothetical protein EPUL_006291 [Erysiphe pulchra]|uniref:Uncharacterized protein n=1 Tax=Erysiphe pulchra TaxID=225359 RepID=A0A2S4PJQ6_9PEZI|nr:hypothetical protein EPUL_006291 [Erysiphe pulchra]
MAACDILHDTPAVDARNILWRSFIEAKAFRATFQTSSSSPGEDEITAFILRIAWPSLGNCITHILNKCAVIGVNPRNSSEIGILDLIVYSDGSIDEDGNAGVGHCIYRGPITEAASGKISLGLCLNNEEAAICLHKVNLIPSSCKVIASFHELRDIWHNRLLIPVTSPGTVILR